MTFGGALGILVPIGLACLAAAYLDWRTAATGLLPPAFGPAFGVTSIPRRFAAVGLIALVFWLGIFLPMLSRSAAPTDFSSINRAQLFLLHGILVLTLVLWYALGHAGSPRAARAGFARQFGVAAPAPLQEIGIGVAAGVGAWVAVLLVLILLGALIWAIGGEDALPTQPPALVAWIAALPVGLRLALSASAGIAEELFFRGFLQPRAGVTFSTVLFVLAHVGYGQPLMLVGVTLLSLVFAGLVRWRQNIWAAVVAHAVFDALQLTVVIPKALEYLGGAESSLL